MTCLEKDVNNVKKILHNSLFSLGGGHYGGCLSLVEILTVLYSEVLRVKANDPLWENRDRLILSKGHGGFALYATLVNKGFIGEEMISQVNDKGIMTPKHANRIVPGVDFSTGSLGQGLSVGAGMALGAKLDKKDIRVYVVLGDGECSEGQVWEAAMFAANYNLNNLICIVDYNKLTFDGTIEEVSNLEPFIKKWEAFGWYCIEVSDGHNTDLLSNAFLQSCNQYQPVVIIAHTIKGKGVPFMENMVDWHSGVITEADYYNIMMKLGEKK